MIISASYKTDIPTFYGDWFMRRLRAGFCRALNSYNRTTYTIDLRPESVDGIVFWTKNVGPFLRKLEEVGDRGYPFVVQHTINGYPKALEASVVDPARSVSAARELRDRFGPQAVVWRYDTIVISDLTPFAFHVENFARLAAAMEGVTDEVVVSFAHFYAKTRRNMDLAAAKTGFVWRDPSAEEKRTLIAELTEIAQERGIALTICSQPEYLVSRTAPARCIDADRLSKVAGRPVVAGIKGNRPGCACYASRDVGEYDTCPHACVYCYAVRDRESAAERYKLHDPSSEYLFAPPSGARPRRQSEPELPFA